MKELEAVTPDNKETDIGKVKVREIITIGADVLAAVREIDPNYKLPEPQMHRLELIDKEIQELKNQKLNIVEQITEKLAFRSKIFDVAKKVKLIQE